MILPRTTPWMASSLGMLLVLVSLCSADAWAAPPTPSSRYEELVQRGVAEASNGNFAEARTLFQEAYDLQADARSARALGMMEFELRNYSASIRWLEEALGSSVRPLTPALKRQTEDLLQQAKGFVGNVIFDLTPREAQVAIDGASLDSAERHVSLAVGDHVVEAYAPGYRTEHRKISVLGRKTLTLNIELQKASAPSTGPRADVAPGALDAPATAREDAEPKRRVIRNPWLWTGVGVALVGAAVALTFALRPDPRTEVAATAGTANTPEGGVWEGPWQF